MGGGKCLQRKGTLVDYKLQNDIAVIDLLLCPFAQDIQCIISSPFLRCLQTAQQISDALELPGVSTCNGIVDVLSSHCGIHEQPQVPHQADIDRIGVKVLSYDRDPLPKYPEKTKSGIKR